MAITWIRTASYRRKMSKLKMGHPVSEETKKKIGLSNQWHWENRREEMLKYGRWKEKYSKKAT